VLLKILQMWQDIRLTNPHGHNQFLGDMFEGFLDQGVKQSEGQFFTPMPICRFIIMSLPLASLIQRSATPPKAIDYACGAGHFLTELALQIKPLVEIHKPESDLAAYYKAFYGIEKEYRLSKVAKVSAFMYGQQEINICYGDALVNQHKAFPEIKDGDFDLLVANPPYSVRGFLETLLPEEERKAYTLTETINDLETSNSIETFFIERAKQLLRADGVAAIILPSSILSNGGSAYIRTREILIQYFDIVAIAEFGSGTFGKTGTNTVTLFLRRKKTAPDTAAHYRERVDEWFKGCDASKRKQVIYKDEHLIAQYAAHIKVPLEDYNTLLKGDPKGAWTSHLEAIYLDKFNGSTEVTNLYKAKWFKALEPEQQDAEIEKRYLAFVQAIERDKLYHFVMASDQPNPVLIIRSPTETKAIKQFLGYEWSSAKGDEGIKLIKDAHGRHLTPLYDETNRDNAAKLNYCIAANFNGSLAAIPTALQDMARTTPLVDMLDFSRPVFEKQISVTPQVSVALVSKWPAERLGSLAEVIPGQSPESTHYNDEKKGLPFYQGKKDFGITELLPPTTWTTQVTKEALKGDILMSVRAPVGDVNFCPLDKICIGRGLAAIRPGERIDSRFLFEFIASNKKLFKGKQGATFESISATDLREKKLPLPPKDVQIAAAKECVVVDADREEAQTQSADNLQRIVAEIASIYALTSNKKRLDQLCDLSRGRFTHRPRNDPKFFGGKYPFIQTGDVVKAKGGKVPYSQTLNDLGLSVSRLFEPPVVLITIAANIGDVALLDYPACFTDSVVGLMPSSEVLPRFLELMMRAQKRHLNEIAPQMAQKNINLEILKPLRIPIPSLSAQKEFVARIEALEKQIAEAQAVIDGAAARKQAILQKYL
jgi:type I restriction-modification system DNA methylase subunit/restriction endonuclease S subunit